MCRIIVPSTRFLRVKGVVEMGEVETKMLKDIDSMEYAGDTEDEKQRKNRNEARSEGSDRHASLKRRKKAPAKKGKKTGEPTPKRAPKCRSGSILN